MKRKGLGRAYDKERASEQVKWIDGKIYRRQKPIIKLFKGRKIDISFALDKSVKGFYAFIESEQLQPSHLGSAQNPLHFIPEAQPRNRGTSASGGKMPEIIAQKLRPAEICEGSSAYTGAPVINTRGEVIQGNGRAFTMRFYYDSIDFNGTDYKDYFKNCQIANFYGFKIAEIEKIFNDLKNPVLVRMIDVSDEEAIRLGNFQQKDTEAVSKSETETKARINRISEEDLEKITREILSRDNGDATLNDLIRNSGAMRYMVKFGVIRADETEKYLNARKEMNAEGAQFVQKFLLSAVFKDSVNAFDYFEKMPYHTQEGIKKGLLYILSLPKEKSLSAEISAAIPEISNFLSSGMNFEAWKNQGDMMHSGETPAERLPKVVLKLTEKLSKPKTQREIVEIFKKYAFHAGDQPATMLEEAKKGLPKDEALQKIGLGFLSGDDFVCDYECSEKQFPTLEEWHYNTNIPNMIEHYKNAYKNYKNALESGKYKKNEKNLARLESYLSEVSYWESKPAPTKLDIRTYLTNYPEAKENFIERVKKEEKQFFKAANGWGTFDWYKHMSSGLLWKNGRFIGMNEVKKYPDLDFINAVTKNEERLNFNLPLGGKHIKNELIAELMFREQNETKGIAKAVFAAKLLKENSEKLSDFMTSGLTFDIWAKLINLFTGEKNGDSVDKKLFNIFFDGINKEKFFDYIENNYQSDNAQAVATAKAKIKVLAIRRKRLLIELEL